MKDYYVKSNKVDVYSSKDIKFHMLPDDLLSDRNIGSSDKLLYCLIMSLTRRDGYCWASNDYFCKKLNMSETQIKKMLKTLDDKDYISREIVYKEGTKEIDGRKIYVKKRIEYTTAQPESLIVY